jgi:hypothetical protein
LKSDLARHLDQAGQGRALGVGGDGVFQIGQDHVDGRGDLGDLGAHLVQVRRHEVDHPLDAGRRLAPGRRRADGQGFEKASRGLHPPLPVFLISQLREDCGGAE